MKLELKHIVGYLPYNLKGLIFYPSSDNETCTLKIKNGFNNECDINDFVNGTYQIKPILRPLSDITKEIEVNGLKLVPIIELFQIAFGGSYTTKDVLIKYCEGKMYISTSISKLCFYPKTKCFEFFEIDFDGNGYSPVTNQLELFEKIYEWHFDIHNLIENNLAIDINTL